VKEAVFLDGFLCLGFLRLKSRAKTPRGLRQGGKVLAALAPRHARKNA
jgi:hypothetical protein